MSESNSEQNESFDSFYKSFFYGTRSDLSFKFLANLSESDASEFFKEFLKEIVNSLDAGKPGKINNLILKWQIKAYDNPDKFTYDDGPFTPMKKAVSQSTIGLLSSSGHFIKGKDPEPFGVKNMTQQEAEIRIMDFLRATPELTEIPVNTLPEDLQVRHGGYDIRAAQMDPNTVFPIQRLNELAEIGKIGKLAETAYTFVGACSQLKLKKESIPAWVKTLKEQALDGLILTPV